MIGEDTWAPYTQKRELVLEEKKKLSINFTYAKKNEIIKNVNNIILLWIDNEVLGEVLRKKDYQ